MRRFPLSARERRVTFDDAAVDRMWSGVDARRARRAAPRVAPRWAFAVAAAAAVVALGVGARRHHAEPVAAARSAEEAHDDGALRSASGNAIAAFDAMDAARTFALSNASHIELARGVHLDVRTNDRAAFVTALHDGHATFDVTPGGSRRWSVECGDVTVDVIGTRFEVEAEAAHVSVHVDHGIVVVRGDRVPDHVQRLVDGKSIDVLPRVPVIAVDALPIATAAATAPSALANAPADHAPAWRALATKGSYDDAYSSPGTTGIARETPHASVEDLLALADVARLSGHAHDAVSPLTRIVQDHADDRRAPLAAFTLGRMELDALLDPAAAADAFARAISLGLPPALVDDAYARLVEAHARAGHRDAARAVADTYAQKYPEGRRSSTIAKWLQSERTRRRAHRLHRSHDPQPQRPRASGRRAPRTGAPRVPRVRAPRVRSR